MKIIVSPFMLSEMLGSQFTYEACKAICDYFDDCGIDEAVSLGDLAISFCEIPASWEEDVSEYEEEGRVIAKLENGNVLISN